MNQKGKNKHQRKFSKYQLIAMKLQKYLFPEGLLPWQPSFTSSPELMTIFMLLFDQLYTAENLQFKDEDEILSTLEYKLRYVLQADTRDVIQYKVKEDFYLQSGEFTPMGEIPLNQTVQKARTVKANDILLVRTDSKELRNFAEVQVLTGGLFNSFDDDWRVFTMDKRDIVSYYKYVNRENRVCDINSTKRFNPHSYTKELMRQRKT